MYQLLLNDLINFLNIYMVQVDAECHGIVKLGPQGFRKERAVHWRERTLPARAFSAEERHLSQIVKGHGG